MSDRRLSWEPVVLRLRNAFRVSCGSSETRTAYWLRLADWLDLDGPLLVANDPIEGATYDEQIDRLIAELAALVP